MKHFIAVVTVSIVMSACATSGDSQDMTTEPSGDQAPAFQAPIAAFRRAAEFDDQQPYDEPEPIPYAARYWLGAALLEAGRYAEAEKEYRTEFADHPHNVWSLHGLKAALDGQGKSDPDVDADFEESTDRMDVWITTSIL